MTETTIQTASIFERGLEWNADQRTCLTFPVGRQRARLLLAADLLAGFADRAVSDRTKQLTAALGGWEGSRKQVISDISLTEKDRGNREISIDREMDKLRRELGQLKALDPDRYLYEVCKAAILGDTGFGQLTTLLKEHILERKGRGQSEVMIGNWGTPESAWIGVQVSPQDGELMEAVYDFKEPPQFDRENFVTGRILPVTWFLEWILRNEALSLELGRSEVEAIKTLAPLEKDMSPALRAMHREVVRAACALRSLSDSVVLVQGARNGPLRLRLRGDYVAHFLPAFAAYRSLSERFDQAREMDLGGLVVVGMGGSGKTTFLRRCYEMLREHPGNQSLNEEIDPKSTAFVVGHMFKDISVPLFDGHKKITLCWMDTAGSEDYRLLGQQLTMSVRELRRRIFPDRPAEYNLLFMWSYEPGHDPDRDAKGFEDVLSKFMDEVEDLGYFDLELPKRTFLLLNKADAAVRDGMAERFALEHEKRFRSVMEQKGKDGESLGFISTLSGDTKDMSDRFLTIVFGLSDRDWKGAFTTVRAGINQGVIGNLLDHGDADQFKKDVYDQFSSEGQEAYLSATVAWIDRFLSLPGRGTRSTRALLRSLRAFLSGEMEGDALA